MRGEVKATGEYTVEYAFHEYGDLGIQLEFATNGDVFVRKVEPVMGLVEKANPDLHQGDVLNDTSTLGMAFSDVMQLLRDTIRKRIETSLTFVPLEDSFETADTAVANWRRRELSCRDDGEFEVYFAPSQPLGFRLTESFLMTQPLCLVSTTRSQLMPLLRCIVTNVNNHDVLGAPSNDVMHLLHDPSTFPKRIWFWKMAPGHDKAYSVVTVATPALLLASMTLSPIDLMFEVPVVHSLLPAPNGGAVAGSSTSRITYKPPPLHHPDSRVRKDQYLMAVNGVSTLNVPHDDNTTTSVSTISMLHGVLEASVPRRLRFRDMDLYKREFQAQRPLSPWKRSELHQSKPTSSRPTADCLDTSDDGSEVTVEAVTTSFSTLVSNNAAAMMGQLDDSTNERVRQSKSGMRRVVLPPSTSPLGLQLETDFSSKYTVFHRYVRTNTVKSNTICKGDRVLFVNGVPVRDIPTEKLELLMKGHVEPRKITVGRVLDKPKRGWSWKALVTWRQEKTPSPQIQHCKPMV